MLARAVSRCGDVQAGRQCERLPSRIHAARRTPSGQARADRALSRARRQVRAPAVHRAVRPAEEHLDPRHRAREGSRQRADVRRLLDPRVQAHREVRHVLPSRPLDLPGAAMGRARVGPHGAHHLRRRRSGRHAVRRRSARAAQEGARRRPRPTATRCRSAPRRSSSSSSAARRTGRRSTRTTTRPTSTSTPTTSPRTPGATSRTS